MTRVLFFLMGLTVVALMPSDACFKETLPRLIQCLPKLMLRPRLSLPPVNSTEARYVCSNQGYRQGLICLHSAVAKCPKAFPSHVQSSVIKSSLDLKQFCALQAGCHPSQVMGRCMSVLSPQVFMWGLPARGSGHVAKNVCKRRLYNRAARCLTQKMKRCRLYLPPLAYKLVKPKNIRTAWIKLCAQLPLFQRYSKCYISKSTQVMKCISKAFVSAPRSQNTPERRSGLGLMCRATKHIYDCKLTVLKSCGTKAAKLIYQHDQEMSKGICRNSRPPPKKPNGTVYNTLKAVFQSH